MANYIENLGLEFLTDTVDAVIKLMRIVTQEGEPILGYYCEQTPSNNCTSCFAPTSFLVCFGTLPDPQ